MVSVLIADDSILIRKRITQILDSDRRIKVVGTAFNGKDAVEQIRVLKPDVVTLDVEMPVMNGLEALRIITRETDCAVVMLSALTTEGAEITIQALEAGAVDFIAKPRFGDEKSANAFARELILKVRAAALSRIEPVKTVATKEVSEPKNLQMLKVRKNIRIDPSRSGVGLGISTGGPRTLLSVIPKIPKDFAAPVFIAQHMPEGFTVSLANRLNTISSLEVREAKNGELVQSGVCYISPGGKHMTLMHMTLSKGIMIRIGDEPESALYKPSVDVLLTSLAMVYGKNAIGIVMTGMGRDGTRGMQKIKEQGGITISEDKSTCVVYGMPKSVEEKGFSDYVMPSHDIPELLISLLNR